MNDSYWAFQAAAELPDREDDYETTIEDAPRFIRDAVRDLTNVAYCETEDDEGDEICEKQGLFWLELAAEQIADAIKFLKGNTEGK